MGGFLLSPGITPLIVDVSILAAFLAIGIGYLIDEQRGWFAGFALVVAALGTWKLWTDWSDLLDVPVALGGMGIGILGFYAALPRRGPSRFPGGVGRGIGALVLLIGLIKVSRDFYDPFDLELALGLVLFGLWTALARGPFRSWFGPSAHH